MSILSSELLNPVRYHVQDPFASIVKEIEDWLAVNQPAYLVEKWPQIKYDYLKRILGLEKKGSQLRGYSQTAPNDDLGSALLSIYEMIDRCVYFTSKYWRALYYWLRHNKFSTCWPQFGTREIQVILDLLNENEMEYLKKDAESEWLDFYADEIVVTNLFKKLKKPLQNLCHKRVSFLSMYDPMYSSDEILQHANEEILVRLRNNDYIPNDQKRLIGWALKCADNAIHNLREKAMTQSRSYFSSRAVEDWKYDEDVQVPKIRFKSRPKMYHLHHGGGTGEKDLKLAELNYDESTMLYPDELSVLSNAENSICVQELLEHADPKINAYLRTICCGEHNPDFWTWFYHHEPTLAQRTAYVAENPEAIGPYLQRHLNLSTHQLTSFLKQHLPEILERVSNTPAKKAMIAYAG
jgi:hypothetical protein